jgi:hypothetical protein
MGRVAGAMGIYHHAPEFIAHGVADNENLAEPQSIGTDEPVELPRLFPASRVPLGGL